MGEGRGEGVHSKPNHRQCEKLSQKFLRYDILPTMTNQPTPNQPDENAERKARHLAMLAECAELTMVLTRLASIKACDQLDPEAPPAKNAPKQPDAVLAFARLSRALRQTIALEAKLATPPKAKATPNDWQATPESTAKAHLAEAILTAAKADKTVIRRHGPTIAHIQRHIEERLDADDVDQDIAANENFAAIVASLCEDLGIPYDFNKTPNEDLNSLTKAIQARQNKLNPYYKKPDDDDDDDEEEDLPPLSQNEDRGDDPPPAPS